MKSYIFFGNSRVNYRLDFCRHSTLQALYRPEETPAGKQGTADQHGERSPAYMDLRQFEHLGSSDQFRRSSRPLHMANSAHVFLSADIETVPIALINQCL
jgi:hypothetical protein